MVKCHVGHNYSERKESFPGLADFQNGFYNLPVHSGPLKLSQSVLEEEDHNQGAAQEAGH